MPLSTDFRINRRRVDYRVRSAYYHRLTLSISVSVSVSFSFALHSFDFDLPQTPIGFVFRNPDGSGYADGGERRGIEFAAPPQRRIAGMRIPRERESNRSVSRSCVNYVFVFVHRVFFGARPGRRRLASPRRYHRFTFAYSKSRGNIPSFLSSLRGFREFIPSSEEIVSTSCAHLRDVRTW